MKDRTSITTPMPTFHEINRIRRRHRLQMKDMLEVLVKGWAMLSEDQRVEAIKLPDQPEPKTGKRSLAPA